MVVSNLSRFRPLRRSGLGQKAPYQCVCGQAVFFRNSICLNCQMPLGYDPASDEVLALQPTGIEGVWQPASGQSTNRYRRCANFETPAGCNWLLPDGQSAAFCPACRLNRTIPDLSVAQNAEHWHRIEVAKRGLVAQLLRLGLPLISKDEDEYRGLAFDFLGTDLEGNMPTTGHVSGLITLNVLEADDAYRERLRIEMREPYRTLLGHFRHETGHYYWDRLIAGSYWQDEYRQLFGDEREDYAQAMQRHYDMGPPANWQQNYVSAYASMHPWEDWAESWAHYLHMMDTLDTAIGFGMSASASDLELQPFTHEALHTHDDPEGNAFLAFINAWIELVAMLNELARSMGQPDTYPFVLSAPVIAKLHFIHRVVRSYSCPA